MKNRCKWVNLKNDLYIDYHDNEWGVLRKDDEYLFEMLLLESFQAGLSWECVLNKRDYFKVAFDNFNYEIISKYDNKKIEELMNNKNIIRNSLKIKAAIKNAKIFIEIKNEYKSFYNYLTTFTNNQIFKNLDDNLKTTNELSDIISNDLYKKGMRFVGSTIIYSYLQAIGIIDDHEINCYRY